MTINFRMKMTFKALFTTALITILTSSLNQINAQTKVGIQAGYNISSVLMKDIDGKRNPTQSVSGFHIGLNVDMPLGKNFYFQPVLEYIIKGFEQNNNYFSGSDNEIKVKANYIQLPINFIYELNVDKGKLYFGAGPYVAYGIGGKWKSKTDVLIGDIRIENQGNVHFKNDFMNGSFGEYLYGKPWELGSNILLGYRFVNQLKVQINNQMGINNLQPKVGGASEGSVLKNRVWSFSLGYSF